MIKAYADNISVPYEYIFYPLLSTIGSLIGVNGKVLIRDGWTEPSCFWVLVTAQKGEKKTACAKLLKGTVRKSIEEDIIQQQLIENAGDGSNQEKPPKPHSTTLVLKHCTPACAVRKAVLCFCMMKSPCFFSSSIITRLDRKPENSVAAVWWRRMVQRIQKWIGFCKKHCGANRWIHSTLLLL